MEYEKIIISEFGVPWVLIAFSCTLPMIASKSRAVDIIATPISENVGDTLLSVRIKAASPMLISKAASRSRLLYCFRAAVLLPYFPLDERKDAVQHELDKRQVEAVRLESFDVKHELLRVSVSQEYGHDASRANDKLSAFGK